jgi:tRNA pseudouridine38-40 synthase
MSRYFLELAYRGTAYSGFQTQENANSVQAEVEKALSILHRRAFRLTGSSRTDAGVHAFQNFFHFDDEYGLHPQAVYKLNAILPKDIVIRNIWQMPEHAHARFDALSREYSYYVHRFKNPFLENQSLYYPYRLNLSAMQEASSVIRNQTNFFPFAKTNTQVKNFNCTILKATWAEEGERLVFTIEANRFLRGMVRLVTASLLKVGREKMSMVEFESLFTDNRKSGGSAPAHALFLKRVGYPENYFPASTAPFTVF